MREREEGQEGKRVLTPLTVDEELGSDGVEAEVATAGDGDGGSAAASRGSE